MVPTPTTDSAWKRRERHRTAGYEAICRSMEYQACYNIILSSDSFVIYLEKVDPARRADLARLPHPSPVDRSLSHRQWEHAVQVWRRELRRLGECGL